MAPPCLPFDVLLLIADEMTDDNGELCLDDLNTFLQVNSSLYHKLNPRLWKEALSNQKTTARVFTHLLKTRNLERLQYFIDLGADVETHLPNFNIYGGVQLLGPSPLIAAAYIDSVPLAELLLKNGAKVDPTPESYRFTAMHAARSAEMVQLLVDHHGDPDKGTHNRSGYKPLHWYAFRNDVAAMRAVLERGVDVDPDFTSTEHWVCEPHRMPLHESAYWSIEAVTVLLEFGADVTRTDDNLDTALHVAARVGRLEIVRLLVDHWPMGVRAENLTFATPLHMAAASGNAELVEFLLGKWPEGAKPRNQRSNTPLHLAAREGRAEVVKILLKDHPDGAKATNRRSNTPLHFAAEEGRNEVVKLLLESWPEGVTAKNMEFNTPLHLAAAEGRVEAVRILLKNHPDGAKVKNQKSNTPLHLAACEGWTEVVRIMLQSWPEGVRAENLDFDTPLHLAAVWGMTEVVKLLLENHPECVKARNRRFHTPLHMAAGEGRTEVLRLLLDCWPDGVKAKTQSLNTPWHCAAESWSIETVRLLLHRWPEGMSQRNLYGVTPSEMMTPVVREFLQRWAESME
jgi:ankyrin repeat protein